MTRRVYLYFALTCLLGVIIGAAGTYYFAWYSGRWHRGFNKERIVRHLTRELNLSPTQVQQVNQIMDEERQKFGAMQKQIDPQFRAIREDTRNHIRQILTPEQLPKFNELVRRVDERRKHMPR